MLYALILYITLFNTPALFCCQESDDEEWVKIERPETFHVYNSTKHPLISLSSSKTRIEPGNTFTKSDPLFFEHSSETFNKSFFEHEATYYQLDYSTTQVALGKSLSGTKETALDLTTLIYLHKPIPTKQIEIKNNSTFALTFSEPEPYGIEAAPKKYRLPPNEHTVFSTATEIAPDYHKMRYQKGTFTFLPHANDNESGQYHTVKEYAVRFVQQKGRIFYLYEKLTLYAATIWWWFNGIRFKEIDENKIPVFMPYKENIPQSKGRCVLS